MPTCTARKVRRPTRSTGMSAREENSSGQSWRMSFRLWSKGCSAKTLEISPQRTQRAQRDLMAGTTFKRDPRFQWFWRMISPLVAAYMLVDAKLTLRTSRITIEGPGKDYSSPAIYVNWHRYVPFLCIHHGEFRRWLLMSSAPYLEPIARWCGWMGLTVVRGA